MDVHQKDTGAFSACCCEVMMSDVSPGTGGVVDCPLESSERRDMPPQSQTLEPRRCLLNEGVMGGGRWFANSEEEKVESLRRGNRKDPNEADGAGQWLDAVCQKVFSRWPSLTFLPRSFVPLMISPVLRSLHPWNSCSPLTLK